MGKLQKSQGECGLGGGGDEIGTERRERDAETGSGIERRGHRQKNRKW